uniref:Retrotransposon gag domain-containing protein n=1 Tax=Heliothis virescens TaxID=7102 RepID=A0A2A4JKQ7_HELVI
MCDLCAPADPETKTFDELVRLVTDHLEPQRSEIAERHMFRLRRQRAGESMTEYLQDLKHLATTCNFGTMLEENLRDQFVSGLANSAMRSRIFAEKNIKYKEAVELALALEAAERHAEQRPQVQVATRAKAYIEPGQDDYRRAAQAHGGLGATQALARTVRVQGAPLPRQLHSAGDAGSHIGQKGVVTLITTVMSATNVDI